MMAVHEGETSIHPETQIGRVHYTVADLQKEIEFYCGILGFKLRRREGSRAALGTDERDLLILTESPGARRVRGTTGLYHTAFLVPTRWDLAHLVQRIIETRTEVHGTSNHGTHLAIYLPDPEGNGIELAWDFPREVWPMKDGKMLWDRMPREGVDIGDLLSELERDGSPWPGLAPGSRVGHIHLHVADLDATRGFYHDVMGFDVTSEGRAMGALFLSAGGYHHHIGTNIWNGAGAPPPPPDATGLREFAVVLPDAAELDRVAGRLRDAGLTPQAAEGGWLFKDPSENGVLLTRRA